MKLIATLAVYAILVIAGLWFGDGTFHNPNGPAGPELAVSLCFFMTAISAVVMIFSISVGYQKDIYTNERGDPWSLYQNPGIRIQIGFNLMSMMMAYGFNAGPFQTEGEVLSPWIIFPILALLPVIHMVTKEPVRAPRGMGIIG